MGQSEQKKILTINIIFVVDCPMTLNLCVYFIYNLYKLIKFRYLMLLIMGRSRCFVDWLG